MPSDQAAETQKQAKEKTKGTSVQEKRKFPTETVLSRQELGVSETGGKEGRRKNDEAIKQVIVHQVRSVPSIIPYSIPSIQIRKERGVQKAKPKVKSQVRRGRGRGRRRTKSSSTFRMKEKIRWPGYRK
jgi:hypothetical protein